MKIKIEDLSHDGKGVGRIENKVVFIENAYPEEVVEVEITKSKKRYSEGKVLEIIEESKDRIPSICVDFYHCGGCQFCDYKYKSQLEFKRNLVKTNFEKFGNIEIETPEIFGMEDFYNYRNHVQLTVKDGKIGYIDKEKNTVFTPKDCIIAPKEMGEIIKLLYQLDLREINLVGLRKNHKAELMLIFVLNKNIKIDFLHILEELKALGVTHIYKNINNNPRFHYGRKSEKLFGEGEFYEEILGNKFLLSPTSFFQVNRKQAELLYKKGIENLELKTEDKVLELFSGIGTMTMEIAKKVESVIAIEYSKTATEDGKLCAKLNNIDNINFIAGKVEDKLKEFAKDFNKVLLDPPRKGADKKVLEEILKLEPEIISYVSCNPATLARDVKILTDDGRYKLEKVEVVDMFPLTSHVETVALLSKLDVDKHINIEIELDELDLTSAESKATYAQIKEYVWNKFELKVSTLYIAQIKRKCGIELREHYNKSKKEKQIIPQCTPEKEEAIMDALRHFKMI